jgi:AcrR family transcriptional regulator
LVDDILEAAVRVLASEGAHRFTTVRVAEKAGVSVGSLYQYFPNKQSLLFRLQANEWEQTWGLIEGILSDTSVPPKARLRRAVAEFFRSERAEADLRVALDDAGALFRDAPEARALRAKATRRMFAFMGEALPDAGRATRAFAADFVFTYLSAIAEKITAEGRSAAEVEQWAEHSAELLCDYLDRAASAPPPARKRR